MHWAVRPRGRGGEVRAVSTVPLPNAKPWRVHGSYQKLSTLPSRTPSHHGNPVLLCIRLGAAMHGEVTSRERSSWIWGKTNKGRGREGLRSCPLGAVLRMGPRGGEIEGEMLRDQQRAARGANPAVTTPGTYPFHHLGEEKSPEPSRSWKPVRPETPTPLAQTKASPSPPPPRHRSAEGPPIAFRLPTPSQHSSSLSLRSIVYSWVFVGEENRKLRTEHPGPINSRRPR